jgi:hypothetical protein
VRILFGTLPIGADLGSGYVLTQIAADAIIRVTAVKGDTPLRVWVCPTSEDVPAYRSTARFRVGYEGHRAEQEMLCVVDRVVEEVARNEAKIPDATYRNVADAGIGFPLEMAGDYGGLGDLQWLAVRAGLKPACRQVFPAATLPGVIARAEAAGLHVACLPAAEYLAQWTDADPSIAPDDTLAFIGATAAAARAALEAERSLARSSLVALNTGGGRLRRLLLLLRTQMGDRSLGRALGYPSCCVKFFVPRVAYAIPDLLFAALERTNGQASLLLNNIELTRALIPHYVCRYDCARSIKYAGALLRELERVDPRAAAALARSLGGLLILFRAGGYMWLRGATADDPHTLAVSAVSCSGEWPERSTWLEAAERSDQVVLAGMRVTFLGAGRQSETLALPPALGIARVFA